MYWLNVSKLAEDLREGRVDEKERFKYFVATFVAWTIAARVLFFPGPVTPDTLLSAAVSLILAVAGIFYCYGVNRRGDNTDFIGRMICLGWPVAVWLLMLFSGLFLIMGFFFCLLGVIFGPGTFFSAIQDLLARLRGGSMEGAWTSTWPLVLPYYPIIGRYLASVAKVKGAEDAHQWTKKALSDAEIFLFIGVFVIMTIGTLFIPSLFGLRSLKDLLTFLAIGLWLLLFSLIVGWVRIRFGKRP
jgi:hypothetical protein